MDVQTDIMHSFLHGCLVPFIVDESGASHASLIADTSPLGDNPRYYTGIKHPLNFQPYDLGIMRAFTVISFLLAAFLVALHVYAYCCAHSAQHDPNGYDMMVVFFYGVPLAILVSLVSGVALRRTKAKRFWVPLGVGLLPIVGWPVAFILEWLRLIP